MILSLIPTVESATPIMKSSFPYKDTGTQLKEYQSQLSKRRSTIVFETLNRVALSSELHHHQFHCVRFHHNLLALLTLPDPFIKLTETQPYYPILEPLIKMPSQRLKEMDIVPLVTRYIEKVITLPHQIWLSHPVSSPISLSFTADSFERFLTSAYSSAYTVSLANPFKYSDKIHSSDNDSVFSYLYSYHHNKLHQLGEYYQIEYDCGKLQKLSELLTNLYANHHRVVLFTQMTRFLDILEVFINHHHWRYYRLDGSVGLDLRQRLIEDFNVNPNIFLFIMSTRAGGLGINLTGADTVIFYDTDWNPQIDLQAQDRCHRIGQIHEVHIYRLITSGTVEENIYQRSRQKMVMMNLIMDEGHYEPTTMLAEKEKQQLFSSFGTVDELRSMLYNTKPQSKGSKDALVPIQELEGAMAKAEDVSDQVRAHPLKTASASTSEDLEDSLPLYRIEKYCLDLIENQKIPEYTWVGLHPNLIKPKPLQEDKVDNSQIYEENLLREEFKLKKDVMVGETLRTRALTPPPDPTLPPKDHFFHLAGNTDTYHSILLHFEHVGYYVTNPILFRTEEDDSHSKRYHLYESDKEDDLENEVCLFSSQQSQNYMIPIRKPKLIQPTVTVTQATPNQLTVRIPRAKIQAFHPPASPKPLKRIHPLMWTQDEDNRIIGLFRQFEPNILLITAILNEDIHSKGWLRTQEDVAQRYSILQAHPSPQDREMLYQQEINKKKKKKKDHLLPISIGSSAVFSYLNDAMKRISLERQSCKDALRQTLSGSGDETLTRAILQIAHTSHRKAILDGQNRMGVGTPMIGKVLSPIEIADYHLSKLFVSPIPKTQSIPSSSITGSIGVTATSAHKATLESLVSSVEAILSSQPPLHVTNRFLNQAILNSPQLRANLYEIVSANTMSQDQKVDAIHRLLNLHKK